MRWLSDNSRLKGASHNPLNQMKYEVIETRGYRCDRLALCPRGSPECDAQTIDNHRKTNRGHGSQNQIILKNRMKQIKIIIPLIALCLFLGTGRAKAQWTVIDPSNIAQSIVNSSKSLVQESTTAKNMVANFQETVKIYQQAKKYYDALQAVNNLVRDARKVQQTVLMLGDISGYYVNNYKKMLTDPNYTSAELSAIASGYTRILEDATGVLNDLKQVVNITTLSMTDKDRMDVVDDCYNEMKRLKSLTAYYTNKNISVSYLRAKKKADTQRVINLYGDGSEKYW